MAHFYKRWLALCAALLLTMSISASAHAGFIPYFPQTGHKLLEKAHVTVDISNAEHGYIMAKHASSENRLKILITHSSGQNKYDLKSDGQYQTFPLSYGSGAYKIEVYSQAPSDANNDVYQKIFSERITVVMPNETASFLYPNQYVWYTEYSFAAIKSMELCQGMTSDIEKVEAIYSYIRQKIQYDYAKVLKVEAGYLPDVDQTLREGAGICFDYASLFACMLRVQGIPTQLAIGELLISDPPVTHAWNQVQVGDAWLLIDPTFDRACYQQAQYVQQYAY